MNGGNTLSPGDTWRPTASWINAVNRMLVLFGGNTGDGTTAPPVGMVRNLQVYNAGSSALAAGQAVNFVSSGAEIIGGLVPCSALSDTNARWGVLTTYLEPRQAGGCVVNGPVKIDRIIGSGGDCAIPVSGGGAIVSGAQVWSRGASGVPLLAGTASGGVVVLEAAAAEVPEYNSYFKITVAPVVSGAAVVTVADGATGSDSIVQVNGGSTYALPPYTETLTSGALYLLKYTPATLNANGGVVSSATMVISSLHESGGAIPPLPSGGTSGAYYYQLGRVIWSGGSGIPTVAQDHATGVAYFNWFVGCNG